MLPCRVAGGDSFACRNPACHNARTGFFPFSFTKIVQSPVGIGWAYDYFLRVERTLVAT
jgi:hypothetical protein